MNLSKGLSFPPMTVPSVSCERFGILDHGGRWGVVAEVGVMRVA